MAAPLHPKKMAWFEIPGGNTKMCQLRMRRSPLWGIFRCDAAQVRPAILQ